MESSKRLEKIIKNEIIKLRSLGEHGRQGSEHLSYRSLSKFKMSSLKKKKKRTNLTYELICTYDVYTETEFLHSQDMDDLYTEHYEDKFVFDANLKLLEIKNMLKKK